MDLTGVVLSAALLGTGGLAGWWAARRTGRPRPAADVDGVRAELARLYDAVNRSHEQTARLASTTGALREVLASPMARGQWGERTADDVLRAAGLVEGVSYVRQRATPSGSVPDVTILLPGDHVLHLDVKFPLANHLRAVEAATDGERAACEAAFLKDVRQRVRELSGRGYVDPAAGTLGFVLLFVPNESVYADVHRLDPRLLDDALGRNVVLCSPLTLFAVLAVVRQAGGAAALRRTSGEVLEVLGVFLREWDRFAEALDKVGRAVDGVERAYGELAGTRRRALERPLARIDELRRGTGEPDRLRVVGDER